MFTKKLIIIHLPPFQTYKNLIKCILMNKYTFKSEGEQKNEEELFINYGINDDVCPCFSRVWYK
ncbi:hypothetical protein GCM10022410_15750 [Amphibacillus indicireducens]|uniref:Uncharacterized protein n=1 Tax=Amphibacillus indicireducens TaxID=1076330 RepID=A0ABP7VQW7_9BACI